MKNGLSSVAAAFLLCGLSQTAWAQPEDAEPSRDSAGQDRVPENEFKFYWKDGFKFETGDKTFKGQIGGRMLHDFTWQDADDEMEALGGEAVDGNEFRAARLFFKGFLYDKFEFKIQIDFSGGDNDFKDVYLKVRDLGGFDLTFGHFKEPFSIEELTSSRFITFTERGMINAFMVPGRNVGLMLSGSSEDKLLGWAVGVFRPSSADDGDAEGDPAAEGDAALTARLFNAFIHEDDGESLLHIGAAARTASVDDMIDVSGFPLTPLVHVSGSPEADFGMLPADDLLAFGIEGAFVSGPVSVQVETMRSDIAAPSGSPDVDVKGWYVYFSYFLSGEHRKYKKGSGKFDRLKPASNAFVDGGSGAWEFAIRIDEVTFEDTAFDIEMSAVSVGMNWYLNPHVVIKLNMIHSEFDEEVSALSGEADHLTLRIQLDF